MSDDLTKNSYTKATYSRAARHCSGVDSETRRQILISLTPPIFNQKNTCDIYAILPDVPQYFWKNAFDGITHQNYPLKIKYNIYTKLFDDDVVLMYLDEAIRMEAKAVVISAYITPEIRSKLESMQDNCAVFLFSEYADIPDTFFFGSNAYADGYNMGQYFCRNLKNFHPLIINPAGDSNIQTRIKGFCDALDKAGISQAQKYSYSMEIPIKYSLESSKIASFLSDKLNPDVSYCLYIPFGTTYVDRILQKLKRTDNVVCLCHDCRVNNDEILEDRVIASMNQDVFTQGEEVMRAAVQYVTEGKLPEKNCTYIQSKFFSMSCK